MASPVDAARISSNISTAADPVNVNLPSGISSGHLLIMLTRVPNATNVTTPSGWTALVSNSADGSGDKTCIFYRKADGSETSPLSVDLSAASRMAAICWRITGAEDPATQAPELSTQAQANSDTPDPTTVTPTGGSKDYLFLWLGGWQGEQTSPPTGNPSGYSNPQGADTGIAGASGNNCRVAGASKQATASSEDPGSWTISVADDWRAYAMAIHPGAAVSVPKINLVTPRGIW